MVHPLLVRLLPLLVIFLSDIYTCSAREHVININGINGTDTDSCLQGETPCATINMALNGSLSFNGIGNTTLYISPGNYTLEYGDFNNINGSIYGIFTIIGSGELETIVECDPGAGLNITSFYEVTIQSITFIGCGFENQLAIPLKFFDYTETIVHASPATLAFTSCQIVSVYNVTVSVSNGSGIIILDTRQASIIGCTVSLGYYLDSYSGSLAVGGIVLLSSDDHQLRYEYGYVYGCGTFLRKLSIAHSTITDNNYQLENEDCSNIKATGAIVVAGANTLELDIDLCLIANNSRALFSYHSCCNSCSYVFNSSMISNNQNTSTISSYETGSYQLNVLMIDTELIDPDPLIIKLPRPPSTSVTSTSFSSTTLFSSYILQHSGYSRVNVSISNPKLFSFDFYEVEECEPQPKCIGYDCPSTTLFALLRKENVLALIVTIAFVTTITTMRQIIVVSV